MKNRILLGLIFTLALGWSLEFNEKRVNALNADEASVMNTQVGAVHNVCAVQEVSEDTEYDIRQMFEIAAKAYDMDFKMVYAIARLETGNFTSSLFIENNNPGGIKNKDLNGWAYFDTQFEGILEMTRLLRYGYIDKGLTTLEAIGSVYCPGSDSWVIQVREIINEI